MMTRSRTTAEMITLEGYTALPPDSTHRYEVSGGVLVREPRPGRPHGAAAALITHHLVAHALEHGGIVTTETGFVLIEEPLTLRGPDVAYVRGEPEPYGEPEGFIRGAPDLAVEVASPSNTASDLHEKVLQYFEAGGVEVWVVHPRTRTVVIHASASEARTLGMGDEITGGDLLPGFRLPVAEIFRF